MPDATNDDLMDPMNYSGVRPVARGPFTNWFEKERLDAMDAHKKASGEDANLNGVYFTVEEVTY